MIQLACGSAPQSDSSALAHSTSPILDAGAERSGKCKSSDASSAIRAIAETSLEFYNIQIVYLPDGTIQVAIVVVTTDDEKPQFLKQETALARVNNTDSALAFIRTGLEGF